MRIHYAQSSDAPEPRRVAGDEDQVMHQRRGSDYCIGQFATVLLTAADGFKYDWVCQASNDGLIQKVLDCQPVIRGDRIAI